MIHFKKPSHKKEVIATEQGWVVKETGELLVSVKKLKSILDAQTSTKQDVKVADLVDEAEVFPAKTKKKKKKNKVASLEE